MRVQRIVQKPWLCGPAVLEMLFRYHGEPFTQDQIAQATGLPAHTITRYGYSLLVLQRAVGRLTGGYQILAHYNSTVPQLARLCAEIPVGVEWRCEFREPDGAVWGEGHYCIVDQVDLARGEVHLVDPYYNENLSHRGGIADVRGFKRRWWDENLAPSRYGNDEQVFTQGLMFALAPNQSEAHLAAEYGLAPITASMIFANRTPPRPIFLPNSPTAARERIRPAIPALKETGVA